MTPRMLRVADVAARLSLSEQTVRRMAASGELPSRRVGRLYRIPVAAVEQWEQGCLESRAADTSSCTEAASGTSPGQSPTPGVQAVPLSERRVRARLTSAEPRKRSPDFQL